MKKFKKQVHLDTNKLIEKYYGKEYCHLNYPTNMIYELLFENSINHPNYVAYEYFGHKVTYRNFIRQIQECAKALKAIGVQEGEVITICTPNMPEAIIMFYAINMVGAISNIIHPLSAENEILHYLTVSNTTRILVVDVVIERIMHIIEKTKVDSIICVSPGNGMKASKKLMHWILKGRKTKIPLSDQIMTWNEFLEHRNTYHENYICRRKKDDPALILYSGGTTGKSKGIVLSNYNFNCLATQARVMARPNDPGDTILCILPIFHGFGLGVCMHTTLCVGMHCVLLPTFSFKEFKKLIKKHRPNFIVGVPTLFENMTNAKQYRRINFKFVKNVISGGDTMSPEMKRRIDNFLSDRGSSARVRVGYGLTECSSAICLTVEDEMRDHAIGIPFPDMQVRIVNPETMEEVPDGENGEIIISGPTVMLGFLNEPEETKKIFWYDEKGTKWLHTGDIGYKDTDGMLFFTSRLKRMIVSSGYNIYPNVIEDLLNKSPLVEQSVVIGVPHPYKVQVAKAFIIPRKGVKPNNETLKEIKDMLSKNIAKYSLPYEYEFRETFPKTKIGKIDFKALEAEEINKKKK